MSAAELRRRVRAVEEIQARTRELAAANALATREAAVTAAKAKDAAEVAAREAAAAVLRLFNNDAELVAQLLDVTAEELEREAKPVTAARAKEVIEELRARAERPRPVRRARQAGAASTAPSAPALASTLEGGLADAG
ncbi:hypothetical protein ACIGZJ_19655 [Kitasatospora sp. NPDC052868]|uniref:hypothetical protein n=1 Tax=Kitasatospora sp. NPDC052868 TaxID=3364060 RepID=UPI0006AEFA16|nr:hypothetical protein ADK94_16265 [Streptomyces sp. XY593]